MELKLIGIGTGNPEHLTLQAIREMRDCDLILLPRKGADRQDLADLRRGICEEHLGATTRIVEFDMPVRNEAIISYRQRVDAWHDEIAERWMEAISAHGTAGRVGLLVWGDPSLYDSTIRIAERLSTRVDLQLTIIPGVTSLQGLTAAHGIPLNEIAKPVVITTGRRLREEGFPDGADTVAVMLDGECSFTCLDPAGLDIWWGAYVGMAQEAIMAGPLRDLAGPIETRRAELRAENGWIMDIYLLRRRTA
ncbi:precorrin-6A synthase (deacetylating) [Chelativorans sp. ZYF759]|uniref:precorrin-6A synthase (deacetylating) n=1 Tax=Chelativorans sp. ZYF759 TaxID=2692213 RepID=UPI001FF00D76|nr:precorrin-6A synthase (deacetylating) [Chelativorans sp. ZYF759]